MSKKVLKQSPRKCANCGTIFKPKNALQKYCSDVCREYVKSKDKSESSIGLKRDFTKSTVYLIHKWNQEGYSVKEIAYMLHRSIERVKYALTIPLTEDEKNMIEIFYKKKPATRPVNY